MISRREFLQAAVAASALTAGAGYGNWSRLAARQALTQSQFMEFAPFGNVTLVHLTDIHAQLMPTYFREPSVNLGVGAATGVDPAVSVGVGADGGAGVYTVANDGQVDVTGGTNPTPPFQRGVVRLTDRATLTVLDRATWNMKDNTTLVLEGGTISGPGNHRERGRPGR